MSEIIRMKNIHLALGGTAILAGVDFQIKPGEIHALIGERRSGKTSLMKILAGEVKPNRGTILLNGNPVVFSTPQNAVHAGIGMVHQNLQILPNLNAVENIFTNTLPKVWFSFKKYARYIQAAERIFNRMGQDSLNLAVPVGTLPAAQQQAVEIARIMAQNPCVVILDQIAERLSKAEMDRLFKLMQEFRHDGTGIVYITENVNEVFDIADRVSVLADGCRKSTEEVRNLDRLKLVRMAFNLALDQQTKAAPVVLRQFNESVIRNLPVGVLIFNQENKLFHANEEAERLCGSTQDELLHRNLSDILKSNTMLGAAEIAGADRKDLKQAWDGAAFGCAEFTRIQIDSIQDEESNPLGRVLLVQDSTLDQTMVEYLARAEKMESTAEIAAGVAHEINNPLGTIRNYVEILRLKNTDSDTGDKLNRISSELDRIVEIISSLLSFSKIGAESRAKVNLKNLVKETITLLGHRFRNKNIITLFHPGTNAVIVQADENRLKQVIVNILVNSIEAVLDGGEIIITLNIREKSNTVVLSVRDNGSGIPDTVIKQIFQPFYSTKASRTNTGLGLSICKHIVESHGGKIEVKSIAGEYTELSVYLPLLTDAENGVFLQQGEMNFH
ncbi:MAG: hypothetical protein B0D92_05005 [Spirochaeta sp. LUC14_002_19_P3]|nr:MAG: hypothetical protein B0D92_05005 [Spirochaeta sp. LUC14_002_19_P3]